MVCRNSVRGWAMPPPISPQTRTSRSPLTSGKERPAISAWLEATHTPPPRCWIISCSVFPQKVRTAPLTSTTPESLMCQVPAMCVSERLEAAGFVRSDWPWESDLPNQALQPHGAGNALGGGNGVGAHASAPLRSTGGPGIREGVERNG